MVSDCSELPIRGSYAACKQNDIFVCRGRCVEPDFVESDGAAEIIDSALKNHFTKFERPA
jgi:hypothetical protein